MSQRASLITIVETPYFVRRVESRLSSEELEDLKARLSTDPTCGISLGAGLYKVRVGHGSRGKSGGVRVVYIFMISNLPVFLLEVFAKNEKDNLSKREFAALAELADILVKTYGA